MADAMRPVPFRDLVIRIMEEWRSVGTVFGISEGEFYRKEDQRMLQFCSQRYAAPVGPAAGPHTQLAQNIAASFLAGGRFMELKTVQKLDSLEVDKPCIEALDEGYNVEWSSELSLEESFDEYLKGWVLVHMLSMLTQPAGGCPDAFIFNMSVGYDLEGILTEKMQRFIDSMKDASAHPNYTAYLRQLEELSCDSALFSPPQQSLLRGLSDSIPARISPSVTLSTMHGCPPDEIEAIAGYLMREKQLDTYVKLNPTLLGHDFVRSVLDSQGFGYITLDRDSFAHDLQYEDAVPMLRRLMDETSSRGRHFGIKLSNTLGCVNHGVLPGEQMYMSGRALYPLTVNLAAKLAGDFDGLLPISYCGGVNASNIGALFACGISPLTSATELLKPSGYLRLLDMAEACDRQEDGWEAGTVDVSALKRLAEAALSDPACRKEFRGSGRVSTGAPLPVTDCYTAPCVAACPIGQDVPEYLYLVGQGLYDEALELICMKNPLPSIMGYICDHQCQANCTRLGYEGAVQIREMKRIAAEQGRDSISISGYHETSGTRAAVIGAGPAGLSAACYLARTGVKVTVFEREVSAGGIVQHVIPDFRLPQEAIDADVDYIRSLGAEFVFKADTDRLTVKELKQAGFTYLLYAVGAEQSQQLKLEPCEGLAVPALEYLRDLRKNRPPNLTGKVVVVGGGNTAMDSARSALRLPGVESVQVLYRRTEQQMPADREEYDSALKDGAEFIFLSSPESFSQGRLTCRRMKLGAADAGGRPRPEPTEETFEIPCGALITAVGEQADDQLLARYGVSAEGVNPDTLESQQEGVYLIGDVRSGPATVVRASADAMKACEDIIDRVLGDVVEHDHGHDHDHESESISSEEQEHIREAELSFFAELREKRRGVRPQLAAEEFDQEEDFAEYESSRCLECSYLCNICVEVCPNRANVAVDVRRLDHFSDPYQIVHLDGYCNECGNCATFCPWEGKPYTQKITVFSRMEDFTRSENPGFFLEGDVLHLRWDNAEHTLDEEELLSLDIDEDALVLIGHVLRSYRYLCVQKEAIC